MNEIVREILSMTPTIKFYNLSFRCYRGIYKNYVVGIHPFVTDIYEIKKPIKVETSGSFYYADYDYIVEILRVHHIDHKNKPEKFWFDPCIFYEEVIGDKIHTDPQNGDQYKMDLPKEFYINQRKQFENVIFNSFRKNKLIKISENE
jgi:hypothetical protein